MGGSWRSSVPVRRRSGRRSPIPARRRRRTRPLRSPSCPEARRGTKKPRRRGAFVRWAEEDSNLHPVIPDQALNLARQMSYASRSRSSVQIVRGSGRNGRYGGSRCCHGAGTQPPAPTPRAVARFEKEDWNLHLVIPSQALTCPSVLVPRAREIVLAGFDDHRLVPHLVAHAHDALLDARERAAAAVLDKPLSAAHRR